MSAIFYILGWLCIVAGAGWGFLIINGAAANGGMSPGVIVAVLPGASVIFAGLVMLALSGILYRLKRIDRHTGDTADAIEDLVTLMKSKQ